MKQASLLGERSVLFDPIPGQPLTPAYLTALDVAQELSQMRNHHEMAPKVHEWAQACKTILRGPRA